MGIISSRRKDSELTVVFKDDTLLVTPDNGKEIAFPLLWHPALQNASEEQKQNWTVSDDGRKICWKELNIEISF